VGSELKREVFNNVQTSKSSALLRGGTSVTDMDVMRSIQELAHREHELREREGRGGLSIKEREAMHSIELRLDQCWDYLRQRRARLDAHLDPDEASVHGLDTIENYRQ
jgi:hypothetical protein